MRVQDVRLHALHHFGKPGLQRAHQRSVLHDRQPGQQAGRGRGAIKHPVANMFLTFLSAALFRARELEGLPTHRALLAKDGEGAEGVATVQRQRVRTPS